MHPGHHPTHTLELRVRALSQLFNSLDPTPFLNRDLDRECDLFIENWALSLPADSVLQLIVHVEESVSPEQAGELLADALHNYYGYKRQLVQGELGQLLGQGRASLAIGVVFVTACLVAGEMIAAFMPGHAAKVARESLTIIGWVAMWRPVQIFLYDWWPLRRRIRTLEALRYARVSVSVVASPDAGV
ncbi:hypothetical protein [Pseudoduganella chitinolytica]|uniref:Uncharacterized protein n=1 Tax=Pseudoduganella chitinolytica TaxID=34070 RepID=A0ABY8B7T2_9BURK|nr:hypothetical protein [Pseudoduganella chitinolytica]WEF31995.1 hypothetical protein PX653_21575 [Pseudoduganella chitinolytica]